MLWGLAQKNIVRLGVILTFGAYDIYRIFQITDPLAEFQVNGLTS